MTQVDPRRLIPRTDQLLALPEVRRARTRLGEHAVKAAVRDVQERARRGNLPPDRVQDALVALLTARTTALTACSPSRVRACCTAGSASK